MRYTSFHTAIKAAIVCLLLNHAQSRHTHRNYVHKHLHRANAPPSNITSSSSSLPSDTVDVVVKDIQNIDQGLSSLSNDIRSFFSALELRLQEVEGLLASLLSSSSTDIPSGINSTPAPDSTTMHISSAVTATTATTLSMLCSAQDCSAMSGTTTMTTTSFITLTRYTSVTVEMTASTAPALPSDVFANSSLSSLPGSMGPSASNPSIYTPMPIISPITTSTEEYDSAITTFTTTASSGLVETITSVTQLQTAQPAASGYVFDAQARDNVAVYYGAGPIAAVGGLLALCQSPNVDIVMLAFLTQYFGPEGNPSLMIEGGCNSANAAQSEAAPGLTDCTELATEIAGCQQIGKPVLLSLGGYLANTSFTSDTQAEKFAETLWDLFGGGGQDADLRPFGHVTIDGFDIDNEDHSTAHYEVFATSLRRQFALDPNNKTYYLSAAPQCPRPDQSIPVGAMLQADFIWVQFYNNPICNLNTTAFPASFAAWSNDLIPSSSNSTTSNSTAPSRPRLFIGAPGFSDAGSGYVPGANLRLYTGGAIDLYVENLGGIMLWDGPSAMANVDDLGGSYLEYAKRALQ